MEEGVCANMCQDPKVLQYQSMFSECDSWQKWSSTEEPEKCSEVHLYFTRGRHSSPSREPLSDGLHEFKRQVGVEFGEDLIVTEANEEAKAYGVLVNSSPDEDEGGKMMLTKVCGGNVSCATDILRIWDAVGPGGNFTVSFEDVHEKKICTQDTQMHRYNFQDPRVAFFDGGAELFDLALASVLGFHISAGLKIVQVMPVYPPARLRPGEPPEVCETAASKAGLKVGMVVRYVEGKRVSTLKEFRKAIIDIYEQRADEEQLSKIREAPGKRKVPDVTINMVVTSQGEDAGERTARRFHELCGESHYKGTSTVFIDFYEDYVQEGCKCIKELFQEDEDEMMVDFKRFVSIYFAVKNREQQGGTEACLEDQEVNDSAEDLLEQSAYQKGAASSKSALESTRMMTDTSAIQKQQMSNLRQSTSAKDAKEQNEMRGALGFMDAYGTGILQLVQARKAEEDCEQSKARVHLFYGTVMQFCLAVIVFGLGAEEVPTNGGKIAPFVATTIAAIVGVVGALFGFLGAVGGDSNIRPSDEYKTGADMPDLGQPSESILQTFLALNLWLMSVLTTFLYTEIIELDESLSQCGAANIGNAPGANDECEHQGKRHTALTCMCGLMLLVVLHTTLRVTDLLDSVNDKTKIEQKETVLTYFRVRMFEAKHFMQDHLAQYVAANYFDFLDNDVETEGGMLVPGSGKSDQGAKRSTTGRRSISGKEGSAKS